eukprot:SAG22_NODE_679_length_7944_cov_2.240408_2_plen_769_part_00
MLALVAAACCCAVARAQVIPHIPDFGNLGGNGVCVDHWLGLPGPPPPPPAKTASRFDGADDYVHINRGLGVHCDLTIDTWVKFEVIAGEHPIMNEDGWDLGDLHYQIYNGEFGFDVNGNGDYTYKWQPQPQQWYYITAMYSCSDHLYNLWVDWGTTAHETFDPAQLAAPLLGARWPMITLDSPRLGSWHNGDMQARAMQGSLAMFRVWGYQHHPAASNAVDVCPPPGTSGLVAMYVFDSDQTTHNEGGLGTATPGGANTAGTYQGLAFTPFDFSAVQESLYVLVDNDPNPIVVTFTQPLEDVHAAIAALNAAFTGAPMPGQQPAAVCPVTALACGTQGIQWTAPCSAALQYNCCCQRPPPRVQAYITLGAQNSITLASMVRGPSSSIRLDTQRSGPHALGLFHTLKAYKSLRDLSGTGHDAKIYGATPAPGQPEQKCALPGFGGKFDGSDDFVTLPALGRLNEMQVDVWVKFEETTGDHPIMNERGWEPGFLHYQIYNGEYGFDINGNGDGVATGSDYTFDWQPTAGQWVLLQVFYSSLTKKLNLWVNNQLVEQYNPARGWDPNALWQPVILNNPRLGAWCDNSDQAEASRSLHGQMTMFRIWRAEVGGAPLCPAQGQRTPDLVVYYVFGESAEVLRDLSGNHRDGHIIDAQYSDEIPPNDDCIRQARGLAPRTFPPPAPGAEDQSSLMRLMRILPAVVVLVVVVGVGAFFGKKFVGRKQIRPGEGLSASIYGGGDGGGGGGGGLASSAAPTSSAPVAPKSTGGTIYD